jgi:hypothetical protein
VIEVLEKPGGEPEDCCDGADRIFLAWSGLAASVTAAAVLVEEPGRVAATTEEVVDDPAGGSAQTDDAAGIELTVGADRSVVPASPLPPNSTRLPVRS